MPTRSVTSAAHLTAERLDRHWGVYLALGVALAGLGMLAVGSSITATFVSVMVFGWALIIGGVLALVHALWRRRAEGIVFDLVSGALYVAVGVMSVSHPLRSAVALTLVLAIFLVVQGGFRIVASIAVRPPHWGWLLAHGVISLALGAVIWAQWPVAGLWVLGLFVGIELVLNGITIAMLAIAARAARPPEGPEEHPPREAPIGAGEAPAH